MTMLLFHLAEAVYDNVYDDIQEDGSYAALIIDCIF